jgi:pyridoxine kinase
VVLSNHVGYAHVGGTRIDPGAVERLVDALDQNGWLSEVDAVLSGYLPSAEHVHVAANLIRRIKSDREVLYLCDPILGDHPKGLYLDVHAATAIRNELVGLADILTPNLFELGWLGGGTARNLAELEAVAQNLGRHTIVVTSAPAREGLLANILIGSEARAVCEVTEHSHVPHGTGDLFAALFLGHLLGGEREIGALGRAAAGVEKAVLASIGSDELSLVASQTQWASAPTLPARPF